MTKPKLSELLKARVDRERKQAVQMLGYVFHHTDESDTVRLAVDEFIERHRSRLPRRQSIPVR